MRTMNGSSGSLTVVITILASGVIGMAQTDQDRPLVSQAQYDEWLTSQSDCCLLTFRGLDEKKHRCSVRVCRTDISQRV